MDQIRNSVIEIIGADSEERKKNHEGEATRERGGKLLIHSYACPRSV